MAKITFWIAILAILIFIEHIHCEENVAEKDWSLSIAEMKLLLAEERLLLLELESFVNKLEHKLKVIQGAFEEMHAEHLKSTIDTEEYLSNPINSYALIRRLNQDWTKLQEVLESIVVADELKNIKVISDDLPTSVDLKEASVAIIRLNMIYNINPADMAAGILNGKSYGARFRAIDCYSIANHMHMKGLYHISNHWLNASLQQYQHTSTYSALGFNKLKILKLQTKVNLKKQKQLNDTVIAALNGLNLSRNDVDSIMPKLESMLEDYSEKHNLKELVQLKETCRQYVYRSRHHCLYNKTTSAFLQLAPLKMEILHLDPYIVLYHDVINDAEIALLKEGSENNMMRAGIEAHKTYEPETQISRTAKSVLLPNYEYIADHLNQRVADMSGFHVKNTEFFQIINYGIGGHYDLHADYYDGDPPNRMKRGDRIATVLFYMSDIKQGGSTVFPLIDIEVLPKKGTALMWYNFNTRGEVDRRTLHAACPVLVGNKWILTKWIDQYDQMFRRPCYT